MKSQEQIPLSRAILWIFLSTVLVSGMSWMGWFYYIHLKQVRSTDNQYKVIAIMQTTRSPEHLKTAILAEVLNLSIDRPINLYQIDRHEATQKLLDFAVIKEVTLKKIRPGTLYIDYTMRSPIAFLGDYTNTAVDNDGVLFPFSPFFTPKNLPSIYLGLESLEYQWGQTINDKNMKLAIDVLKEFQSILSYSVQLKQIDVSKANDESFGKRQIVLLVKDNKDYYLRLDPVNYSRNLQNYQSLRPHLQHTSKDKIGIIDFRIDQLAFIKTQ